MIGTKIEVYIIKELIVQGGMGDVYLGVHESLGNRVAIKMLNPILSANDELRLRFKEEALALSKFSSPVIVQVITFSEQQEGTFLVMQYIDGITLDKYIAKKTLNIEEIKGLFVQMLDAVELIHDKGIEHRDIKPSNFMVDERGHVTLIDFGIAKRLDGRNHKLTKTGIQIGTPHYMSPEQVKIEDSDKRSDIYSLGVTLFEMASGKCPYDDTITYWDLQHKIVQDPLPELQNIFNNIIKKATAKIPVDRYQSIKEFKLSIKLEFESVKAWDPKKTLPGIPVFQNVEIIDEQSKANSIKGDASVYIPKSTLTVKKQRKNIIYFIIGIFLIIVLSVWLDGINKKRELIVLQQENRAQIERNRIRKANTDSIANSLLWDEGYIIKQAPQKPTSDFFIGQNYGGGIIFHIDETGKHGLIAANHNLNGGYGNSGMLKWNEAKSKCNKYSYSGYNDWRLPTKNELILMYDNLHKKRLSVFEEASYWSSTERGTEEAWLKAFDDGTRAEIPDSWQGYYDKINGAAVRCVRSF